MQLSPHFTLAEALRSDTADRLGIANGPSRPEHERNLFYTAKQMEKVRSILGDNPVIVSSWYRNRELNRAVGGVRTSAHAVGLAVDFSCPGYGSVLDVAVALRDSDLMFDQLIYEYHRWIHIAWCNCPKPRREVLTKLDGRPYAHGLPGA